MRWLPIALVSMLPLAGCVVHHTDNGNEGLVEYPGDITFRWSFSGASCAQTPEVAIIHITLYGPSGLESLDQGGDYKCDVAGDDGIVLLSFNPGSYTFTIDAYDLNRETKYYTATGTLYVNGDVSQNVALNPVFAFGRLQISWTFVTSTTTYLCSDVVSQVRVHLNNLDNLNNEVVDTACTYLDSNNDPVQGWVGDVVPGNYQIYVEGLENGNVTWKSSVLTAQVVEGPNLPEMFELAPF